MVTKDYFKKAQGSFILIGIIGFILIGLLFFLTMIATNHFLLKEVNTMVQEDAGFSNASKESIQELSSKNNSAWDNAFAWLVGGLLIGMFLAGATFNNSPVMIIVVLLLMGIVVYSAMHIVNLYEEFSDETVEDLDFASNFPKANSVMNNLVLIVIAGVSLFGIGIFISERIGL